jgi:hypothetical protein
MDARTGNSKTTHGLGERKRTGEETDQAVAQVCLRGGFLYFNPFYSIFQK